MWNQYWKHVKHLNVFRDLYGSNCLSLLGSGKWPWCFCTSCRRAKVAGRLADLRAAATIQLQTKQIYLIMLYIIKYIYIHTVITCNMYGHKISLIFVIIFHRSGVSLTVSLSLSDKTGWNDLRAWNKTFAGPQGNNWIITPISRAYGRYIYTYTYHSHIVYKPTNITGRAIIG